MKKIVTLLLAVIMTLTCVACVPQEKQESINVEPKIAQIKTICELAVMECYYHDVAKYFEEEAVKGFLGLGKKDKHFWIEYSGIVTLGIDTSLVSLEVSDTKITITIPEAKVLSCKVDSASLSSQSFIVDKNSAAIEAADEVKAFEEAQSRLEETASADQALLGSAQQRAQALIAEYIMNIGEAVSKQYTIQWISVDANGNTQKNVNNTIEIPTETEVPAV